LLENVLADTRDLAEEEEGEDTSADTEGSGDGSAVDWVIALAGGPLCTIDVESGED